LDAEGRARRIEKDLRGLDLAVPSAQRREVIEDTERAPLSGDDEIAVLDREVRDGRRGQVALEALPLRAAVEREEEAVLGAGEEHAPPHRVLPYDARE